MRDADIERLFVECAQPLYAFAAYHTGDAAAAEEVVGDTFERLLRTRRRFDPRKGSERSWMYAIALNLVRDRQRRADAERRAINRAGDGHARFDADDALARVDLRDELARALDTLDPDVREILALRFGADLRLKDIAELTGRPLSTVHECLHRGLRELQRQLSSDAPPEVVSQHHGG